MKKQLLISLAAMLGGGLTYAETPEIVNGFAVSAISPDGKYITSEIYGSVSIRNIETGDYWDYFADDVLDYSTGHGNCWSRNGIMVGSTEYNGDAAYWKDGNWYNIASAVAHGSAYTNAISADGKYIVGDVNNEANTMGYDGTMMIPALWIDEDGDLVYEKEVMLPHPELDFFGRYPQYINALAISGDGSVIIGQIKDCVGIFHYPIKWVKNSEGEWEYSFPGEELFNPDHIELPAYPEDPGNPPSPLDYMTDSEKAAYEAALQAYYDSGYNEELWPDPADYLSGSAIEEYNAAVDEYNAKAEIWNEELPLYQEAYNAIVESSVKFVFNSIAMAENGKYFAMGAELPRASFWDPAQNYAVRFNLADGTYDITPGTQNVAPVSMADDGSMLGANPMSFGASEPSQAYICLPGSAEFILLYDYFQTANPGYASFMDDYMVHDIETFDENWDPIVLEDVLVTGIPYCSADMSVIACQVTSLWEDDYEYNSYIFGRPTTGVKSLSGNCAAELHVSAGGTLTLKGDIRSLEIYEMAGGCVYTQMNPAGVVMPGLSSGIYVAKITDAAGNAKSVKIAL